MTLRFSFPAPALVRAAVLPRLASALLLALAALGSATASAAAGNTVVTDQVRAEFVAFAPDGVQPGQSFWVGLSLAHQPEWHTYWKNSGDSGLPTTVEFQLPPGLTAGEIDWPVPRKIPIGTLANYGYDGRVLLPVPIQVAPGFKAPFLGTDVTLRLHAAWLVCRKECIPQEGDFELTLPIKASTAIGKSDFDSAFAARPAPLAAGASAKVDGQTLVVSVPGLPAAAHGQSLEFFPETPDVIETAAAWTQAWQGDTWTARVPLSSQRSQSPEVIPVVLTLKDSPTPRGWRTEARLAGGWPKAAVAAPGGVPPALAAALAQNAATGGAAPPSSGAARVLSPPAGAGLGFWAAIAGALLGGLILNLMPCVFPVLAIKVVGFARLGTDRAAQRASGYAYSAGVVLSFIALGALVLVLRAAGEQLGWGFQLQSPAVVAVLAALFTVIGLNLAGLFEFGGVLPSSLASLSSRRPAVDAFLSGVLAVAIASPCTAPFMGASVGLAIALPAVQALAVFAALGVGMALPYLAASLVPAVARALPRPGPWMAQFRRFMAFPMFATVAWLTWVLGQQSGIDGAAALLALLVALSALLWSIGLAGRARWAMGGVTAAVLVAVLALLGPSVTRVMEGPATTVAGAADGWQPWAPGKVDQIVAGGRPVFVDFTAAWCVTCQYNKKATLSRSDVLADLASKNVALLRADWTRRDPAITAALAELGRNGVPVYVFYAAGRPPVVLSEVLGIDEVRGEIAKL